MKNNLSSKIYLDKYGKLIITVNIGKDRYYKHFDKKGKKDRMSSVLSFSKVIIDEKGLPIPDPTDVLTIKSGKDKELILTFSKNGNTFNSERIPSSGLSGTISTLYHMMKSIGEIDSVMQIAAVNMMDKRVADFKGTIQSFFTSFLNEKTRDSQSGMNKLDINILQKIAMKIHEFNYRIIEYTRIMRTISSKILEKGGVADAFNEIASIVHEATGENIMHNETVLTSLKHITDYSDAQLKDKYGIDAKVKWSNVWRDFKNSFSVKGFITGIKVTGAILAVGATLYRLFIYRDDVDAKDLGEALMA